MKIIERYSIYVVNPKSITQATIAESRYFFTNKYGGRPPTEIRLGSKALNDMCAEIGIDKIPEILTNETVQGMLIKRDPSLKPDEWLIASSSETVREEK